MKLPAFFSLLLFTALAHAADPKESDYYTITTFDTPRETRLEVSSMELLPGGMLALGTRRGEVWTVSGADGDLAKVQYQRFAGGQHEIMGLAWKDGSLYITNRYEVVRLKDEDGDGRADTFATVTDDWGVSGDYHEYTFGSRFDKNGDLWVAFCLTGSFTSEIDFRGWALRVKPDGKLEPTCSGIRSLGGIDFDADGEVYYTDNQGAWHGSSTLQHLKPGSFQGHPGGLAWYDKAPNIGPRPVEPNDKSRMVTERERIKQLVPPAVYMVHGKIGNSSSFIVCETSEGKFGPFQKQIFVADQCFSNISRVFLEEVNGIKQGVVFPFLQGFKSGILAGRMNENGQILVGGSDRGWGSKGGKRFCFDRVDWTGKVPFEVHEMRARPDGFELTFTEPVDPATAGNPASYKTRAFTYIYQSEYGSPEVDEVIPRITKATVRADNKSVRLTFDKLTKGHVHELHRNGVKSATGLPVLHPSAYYTLNEIPAK